VRSLQPNDLCCCQTDDQIVLLQHCWAELLCINACWKTVAYATPAGCVRVGRRHVVSADLAHVCGVEDVMKRLVDFSDALRSYDVGVYDIVAMKTLLLLSPGSVLHLFPRQTFYILLLIVVRCISFLILTAWNGTEMAFYVLMCR